MVLAVDRGQREDDDGGVRQHQTDGERDRRDAQVNPASRTPPAAGGRARHLLAHACERVVIAVGDDHAVPVGRLRSTVPHGSTIIERPYAREAGGQRAVLVRGDDEALVLDRPRAQQHLPVVAAGARVNAAGTVTTVAPRHGEAR